MNSVVMETKQIINSFIFCEVVFTADERHYQWR